MKQLEDLNPVQQEAVRAANGPVMIVAGAGSGKTRVLTYRIAYLISCGVPPSQILALTFTNKAANEMKQRIIRLVGESASQVWMGTFHSVFARILRREAQYLGYTTSFTIYDSDDSQSVVKKCMAALNISTQQFNPSAIRSRISAAKNQIISPRQFVETQHDYFGEQAGLVFAEYEKTLRRNNALDFDDLLIRPIDLFQKHEDVLQRYQYRFKFVLVDEFQDTNRAQYVMTKLLGGAHHNICVVGDDAQSIYSFRGADIRNILDFERDFPKCQTFRLEQNYRSTKSILHAADKLIRYNQDQIKKELWTDNPLGDPVTILECQDEQEEGQRIVRAIQQEASARKLDLKDMAILYRTNAQSRSLEDALRRSSIPYVIVGGVKFYERREIKDVLGYLRLLANSRDDESFLRVVNVPARGLGDTSIEHLTSYARSKGLSLWDALDRVAEIPGLTDRARKSIREFGLFMAKYAKLLPQLSLGELVRMMVDELGFLRQFKEEGTVEAIGRWENVQELLSAVSEYAAEREEATLAGFLEEVSLVSDIDLYEGTRNAVTLMTLHASKGLEFPVVCIAGLEEGLLPFYAGSIEKPDLEEERRLFYVGITRAEQKLYLTFTRVRYRFGDVTYPSGSRFISEIGGEMVDLQSLRPATAAPTAPYADRRRTHVPARPQAREEHVDQAPDYESESQEYFEVKKGARVVHETFGKGKVVELIGKGETRKASVQFDQYGLKHLVLKYANLRPA